MALGDTEFTSIGEVDEWLNHEFVQCLFCPGKFAAVGGHMFRAHQITAEEVRELYGIPHNRGLIGTVLKDRHHDLGVENLQDPERMAKFLACRDNHKPYSKHSIATLQLKKMREEVNPAGRAASAKARREGPICSKGLHPDTEENIGWTTRKGLKARYCRECRRVAWRKTYYNTKRKNDGDNIQQPSIDDVGRGVETGNGDSGDLCAQPSRQPQRQAG